MDSQRHPFNLFKVLLLSALLTGCMLGPNFRSPSAPPVKQYTEKPLPAKTAETPGSGGNAQFFLKGKDIPAEWWKLFHSPEINKLVSQGLKNSPNLTSAYAALKQAQENLNVQIGNTMYPAVDANAYALRQRYATAAVGIPMGGITFDLYHASVNVSYMPDVFGGARREIESLRAQVDYQQFELMAAYLTLTSNIVTTAISVASYQAQIEATQGLIKSQQGLLGILNKQYQLGGISQESVLTQKTLVEQTNAGLPPLQKSLAQSKHALAALVGTFPDRKMPHIKLDALKLPSHLPVSLPSNLVRQRPDVRAAEALLHSACAQIGVATANLFPQFTLTGTYGWTNIKLSQLFTPGSNVWSLIGQVAQPIFRGGALRAQRRAAIAAFQQAAAQYRQTVLLAFQNVADTLTALETDARSLQAQKRAEEAARGSLVLTQNQYRLGGTSYINLLNAQQQYEETRINRIQAQAARYSDTAALFQALGGGWWHKPWCVKECV